MKVVDISNFNKYLENEIDFIIEEFLNKYIINIRKIEEEEIEEIKHLFSSIIEAICKSDFETSVEICKKLIDYNMNLSIPYVMLTHELINLKRLIMERLLYKDAKDEIYHLYNLNMLFEDMIANVYLDKYIKDLQKRNSFRISSLNDIYEKNIIIYYKAHLEWLNDLTKSVARRDNKFFPEINHTLCTFGKWLKDAGKKIIQNNSKYKNICKLHENLHYLANQIKNYLLRADQNHHILLTYLEKCEMLSLSLGTEIALIDNTLINSEASKDPLTGALNRQKLNQLYFNQLEIAFATSETFVLAMCDLDNFKKVNDTYGHVAGDEMLKSFVKISKRILRSSDMLIRYGGEEFMFILPAIKIEKAKVILNEIKDEFASFILDFEGNKISTTLSFGTLELNPEADEVYLKNFESVVSLVDKKLYEAKNSGKNRVC